MGEKAATAIAVIALLIGAGGFGFGLYGVFWQPTVSSGSLNTYYDTTGIGTTLSSGESKNVTDIEILVTITAPIASIFMHFECYAISAGGSSVALRFFFVNSELSTPVVLITGTDYTSFSLFHVVSSLTPGTYLIKVVATRTAGTGTAYIFSPKLFVQTFIP